MVSTVLILSTPLIVARLLLVYESHWWLSSVLCPYVLDCALCPMALSPNLWGSSHPCTSLWQHSFSTTSSLVVAPLFVGVCPTLGCGVSRLSINKFTLSPPQEKLLQLVFSRKGMRGKQTLNGSGCSFGLIQVLIQNLTISLSPPALHSSLSLPPPLDVKASLLSTD